MKSNWEKNEKNEEILNKLKDQFKVKESIYKKLRSKLKIDIEVENKKRVRGGLSLINQNQI